MIDVPVIVRERLALALDVPTADDAGRLLDEVGEAFGVIKVGLELFLAAGFPFVDSLSAAGWQVFLDLKLHDIPTTVGRAASVVSAHDVAFLTVHTSGGEAMVRAAVDAAGGHTRVLGVTVLTSDADASDFDRRVAVAANAGCWGVVCSALELEHLGQIAPQLHSVVPGIRMEGASTHDQARVATPNNALRDGASLLVIGRAVTGAENRLKATESLVSQVASIFF
jgi:orotidine-5'-phosphate decarboxylase